MHGLIGLALVDGVCDEVVYLSGILINHVVICCFLRWSGVVGLLLVGRVAYV